jgi:hypothetical protein
MGTKTLVVVLIVVTALFAGAIAFHGHGHQLIKRWLPAIHGGH